MAKSVVNKVAGLCGTGLGSEVYTVGSGGQFSTIKQALDYIATLTMMDEVNIGSLTMAITAKTNIATFNADARNVIRPGDLLYLDNDQNPLYGTSYTEHYYPVMRVGGQSATDFDIVLATGLVGNTKAAGYVPKVYRPRKYTLILSDGYHEIDDTDQPKIPDGCDITIMTLGSASIYNKDIPGSLGAAGAMFVQRYGYTTLRNLWSDSSNLIEYGTDIGQFPHFEEGMSFLTMSQCQINADWSFGNGISLAAFVANDIVIHSSFDHSFIPSADYTVVDGWSVYVKESTDIMSINSLLNRPTTHRKKLRNINCHRDVVARTGAYYCIDMNAGIGDASGNQYADIQNMNILDARSDALAVSMRVKGSIGGGEHIVNVVGGTIDNLGASYKGHLETAANARLRLRDVKDRQGNQNTISAANAGIIEFLDDDGQQNIAYASTITPNFNYGCKVIVGVLTGGLTVQAPAGTFVPGKRLTFTFEQPPGGGSVIIFNAVFKAPTNPVGGGNQKAIYEFEYDGLHWIQVNQPVWS